MHPHLVTSEDANMFTELQLHLKDYEGALKLLVKHCGERDGECRTMAHDGDLRARNKKARKRCGPADGRACSS